MVVEDLVLGEEEAVEAPGVDVHFFNGFSFKDVLVDLVDLGVAIVRHVLQARLPDQVAALGEDPDVPVLHLSEFKL